MVADQSTFGWVWTRILGNLVRRLINPDHGERAQIPAQAEEEVPVWVTL